MRHGTSGVKGFVDLPQRLNLPAGIFKDCWNVYETRCFALSVRISTIEQSRRVWFKFSLFCLASNLTDISLVPKLIVYTWVDSLGPLSKNTRNKLLSVIRLIVRVSHDEGLFDKPPFILSLELGKRVRLKVDVLTSSEVEAVRSCLWNVKKAGCTCYFHRVLFELCLLGLRSAEMRRLRWEDFRPGRDWFEINTKGDILRSFPISAELRDSLVNLMRWNDAGPYVLHASSKASVAEPTASSLATALKLILKRAGVRRDRYCGPHLWRHSVATLLFKASGNLEKCKQYLGHQNLSTTEGYIHLGPEDQAQGLSIIKNTLKGGD